MAMRKWPLTLVTMQSAGAALASSTTATSLLRAEAKKRLDPGWFYSTGLKHQIKASGLISTLVTTPGTLTMSVRFTGAPDSAAPTRGGQRQSPVRCTARGANNNYDRVVTLDHHR